jgi:fructose transport system substrate-binding protein
MERCLTKNPAVNVVYTINEPAAVGAQKALKAANVQNPIVVSIDGGCDGVQQVKDGLINATSQQYPVKMAELGVKAIKDIETGGPKPQVTPGLDFYDTGVALVTDKAVPGVESISVAEGTDKCRGKK